MEIFTLLDRQSVPSSFGLHRLSGDAGENAAIDIGAGALRQRVGGVTGIEHRGHTGGAQRRVPARVFRRYQRQCLDVVRILQECHVMAWAVSVSPFAVGDLRHAGEISAITVDELGAGSS